MENVNNYLLNINGNDEIDFQATSDLEALRFVLNYFVKNKITAKNGFIHNWSNETRLDFDYDFGFLTKKQLELVTKNWR
jgi:hypothetical protein